MKYDNELFELSDYFKTVNKHEKDSKDIEIKKRKLFRLILDKFRQSKPEDGVFKVKFDADRRIFFVRFMLVYFCFIRYNK